MSRLLLPQHCAETDSCDVERSAKDMFIKTEASPAGWCFFVIYVQVSEEGRSPAAPSTWTDSDGLRSSESF